jgi:hypothetical protein
MYVLSMGVVIGTACAPKERKVRSSEILAQQIWALLEGF